METARAASRGQGKLRSTGARKIGLAQVCCNESVLGKMAAEHFLERGFTNFAFFAFGNAWYIDRRRDAFVQALADRGCNCHVYPRSRQRERALPHWRESQRPKLAAWLRFLPLPLALHTAGDLHAMRVLETCRSIGIAVPEQIAVLGVDNDLVLCEVATPLYPFPEVEPGATHTYGTPWPLSEDFYLCNFKTGLYLLDRYGNREVICDPGGDFLLRDSFPLRTRTKPPVVPVKTWDGKRASLPGHHQHDERL